MSLFIIISYVPSLGTSNKLPYSGGSATVDQIANLFTAGLVIGIGAFAAVVLVIVIVTALVLIGVTVISRRGRHKRLLGILIHLHLEVF